MRGAGRRPPRPSPPDRVGARARGARVVAHKLCHFNCVAQVALLRFVAACWSLLQLVGACCSLVQDSWSLEFAACCSLEPGACCSLLQIVATCWSLLQLGACSLELGAWTLLERKKGQGEGPTGFAPCQGEGPGPGRLANLAMPRRGALPPRCWLFASAQPPLRDGAGARRSLLGRLRGLACPAELGSAPNVSSNPALLLLFLGRAAPLWDVRISGSVTNCTICACACVCVRAALTPLIASAGRGSEPLPPPPK